MRTHHMERTYFYNSCVSHFILFTPTLGAYPVSSLIYCDRGDWRFWRTRQAA